ncbi:hypothetical protein J7T55_007570 [Diaporthe amygdali]|uniref:uncharacterized protein n=1 Tax=Phomopsis amygdali TaxID=1214568 RepID=UPI0022FDE358|nr:uncharacterized protein J7T55_007570 [Diaporthe amygdali]KAJ0107200.1 hypothetical protein J7T55_007570 [Diaporthe amygdali]
MGSSSPDWQLRLEQDGFVVLPNRISAEDCAEFREEALSWLEKFPHGFKRNDRSTWTSEHLPYSVTGGLYNRYSIGHEAFVWKIRSQPKIVEAFAQLWGTDDLIASFDGINITLPINEETGRTDLKPTGAWPHMDQNPRKYDHFELYQGIANLAPNGPEDGGLCVLKGSHLLHENHFAAIGGYRPEQDVGEKENGYNFRPDDADWYKARGCEEVKVCAGEGDLILWDSRLIHWNASPSELARKLEIFKARKSTTHWPQQNVVPVDRKDSNAVPRRPDGTPDPANRTRPFLEPEETPAVLRLVGVRG